MLTNVFWNMKIYIPQHWGWILNWNSKEAVCTSFLGFLPSLEKKHRNWDPISRQYHIHIANALAQMVHLHPLSSLLSTPPIPPESVLKRGPCVTSVTSEAEMASGIRKTCSPKWIWAILDGGHEARNHFVPWPSKKNTEMLNPALIRWQITPVKKDQWKMWRILSAKTSAMRKAWKHHMSWAFSTKHNPWWLGPKNHWIQNGFIWNNGQTLALHWWKLQSITKKQVYTECTHIRCEGCNPPPKCVFECIKRFGRVSWILAMVLSLFASINPPINPAIHPPKSPWETSKRPFDVHLGPIKDGIYMYLCTQNSEIRRWSAHLTIVQSLKTKNFNGPIFLMLQWLLKYQALQFS